MVELSKLPATLCWGVKTTFRSYISRLPDFTLHLNGGADVDAANHLHFPLDEAHQINLDRPPENGLRYSSQGIAVFQAHGGILRLTLENPAIIQRTTGLVLIVRGAGQDVEIADLTKRSDTEAEVTQYAAHLTDQAVDLFHGMYQPGTELDPVTIIHSAASTESP